MKTKSGLNIPASLTAELRKNKSLKLGWDLLRPSCQRDYSQRVSSAITKEARHIKLKRVIELTREYAKKHPGKYQPK